MSGLEDSDEGGRGLSGLEDSDEGGRVLSGLEEDSGGGGRVLEEGDMGVSDSSKSLTSSRILEPFLTPGKRDCLGCCPNTNSYGVVFIVPCTVVFSWSTQ